MRAGKDDGFGQVYDQEARVILYQDEYVVSEDKGFVSSSCRDAPFPLTEGQVFLTNWRLVVLGPSEAQIHVDRVSDLSHSGLRVRPELSQSVCSFLEVYLDEVTEFKKSLLGELKLKLAGGSVEVSGISKPFRVELLKALEWYKKSGT